MSPNFKKGYDSASTTNNEIGKARDGLLAKIQNADKIKGKGDSDEDDQAIMQKQIERLSVFHRNMGLDYNQQIAEEAQTAQLF